MFLRLSPIAGLFFVVVLCSSAKTISAEKSKEDTLVDLILAYGPDISDTFIQYLDRKVPGTKCVLNGLKNLCSFLKKMECTDYFECKLNMDKFELRKAIRDTVSTCGEGVVRKFAIKASILASKQLKQAYYIGMAADLAQYALEQYNFTLTGKVVGAIGSIGSGGLFGCALGGGVGAVVGGVSGFALWVASEKEIWEMLEAQHDIAELQSMCVSLLILY